MYDVGQDDIAGYADEAFHGQYPQGCVDQVMPVFTSKSGRVVAWSGIQAGPIEEYEPIGTPSGWVRYEGEVVTGEPETARVVVRIQKSWRNAAPAAALTYEAVERQAVEERIKPHAVGDKSPLQGGVENGFSISEEEMLKAYRSRLDSEGNYGEGKI